MFARVVLLILPRSCLVMIALLLQFAKPGPAHAGRSAPSFSATQAEVIVQKLVELTAAVQTGVSHLGHINRHFTANVSAKEVSC